MSSLIREPNGRKVIQYRATDGKRRSLRLGKLSENASMSIKVHVDRIESALFSGEPVHPETARWRSCLPDGKLRERLVAVGLAKPRQSLALGKFIENFIASRNDVKPATLITYRNVQRHLVECFGADKSLRDLTPADADRYRSYLVGLDLADNTIRKRCGIAKQFLDRACRWELIDRNPFDDLPSTARGNPKRFHFIDHAASQAVIDACPDDQWRLLFALARYGGLRCPSEILALTWQDVNWEKSTFTVTSSKTEHHEGKGTRVVPLFPELRQILRSVFESAEPGSIHVITRYRGSNVNLRTQLNRIIHRAGLKPWPKLFQNLRSSRETELIEHVPINYVTAWLGNSPQVAMSHYLQTRPEYHQQVVNAESAVHFPVQQPGAASGVERKSEESRISSPAENTEKYRAIPQSASGCSPLPDLKSGPNRARTCDLKCVILAR